MKTEKRTQLEASVDVRKANASTLGVAATSAAVTLLVLLLPAIGLYGGNVQATAVVHLLLELAAFVMATHIISMAWSGLSQSASSSANVLIFGFGVVAGVDLMHALTYESMPTLLVPVGTPTAIFFWLCGRALQLGTMAALLARFSLPGTRALWLQAAIVISGVIAIGGTTHLDWFPSTFEQREGVTTFKTNLEYILTFGCLVLASGFYVRFKNRGGLHHIWLALASFLMGMSGLASTAYATPSELSILLAHLLKLGSYACVHRAAFINGLESPLRRLVHAQDALKERESELKNILENLPASVSRMDENLRFRYINTHYKNLMQIKGEDISGLDFENVIPSNCTQLIKAYLQRAITGEKVEFNFTTQNENGHEVYRHVVAAPARKDDGKIDGVLTIITDVTDREIALKKLAESTQEVVELKAAVDAHAIVAVTDARGVITRVNDKFCTISQYPRDELMGKTHRIINSDHHPKEFFADLWKTISRGEVWNGEICNKAKDGSLYWVHTTIVPFIGPLGVPIQYIAIRADITKRKEAEENAQRMALHDVLTGLPNRRLMWDRLSHAIAKAKRERQYAALLLLDMDNFKEVNDTLGHAAGDSLLRQITSKLVNQVRQNDTVARLGGDEFVIILENVGQTLTDATANTVDLSEEIREELGKPFYVNHNPVNSTPSIGIVLFRNDENKPEELLQQADMALYKAKAEGRNRLSFFDPELQSEINTRAELLRELRLALPKNELRLFYQPVVDADCCIVGFECLIRWQHPKLGLVSPAAFIPLAEQSNLILPIGEWVMREACRQLKAWGAETGRNKWTLAVNVSAKQFHDNNFVNQVTQILEETDAPTTKLRLELTESMLHKDLDETVIKMRKLQELGVRFSLDDFGTGYSSLSYLKKLPLDQLKIDRSFVSDVLTDPNDAAIARTILSLANTLSLNVVAEGVETKEQMNFLKGYGCEAYQGYLFGKPVPPHQIRENVVGYTANSAQSQNHPQRNHSGNSLQNIAQS